MIDVDVADSDPERVIFYLHGGAYAIGTAASSFALASDLARRAGTRLVTIDYRLAPEHPHPAALEDAVGAYQGLLDTGVSPSAIAVAGESAGAGLAVALLVALKHPRLPQPSAAVLMSPWADLTLSGHRIRGKAAVDPAAPGTVSPAEPRITSPASIRRGAGQPDLRRPHRMPPLLIQAGSHEILLDDATRLAARAAAADVAVALQVTPGVPHVFQGTAAMLDDADRALARAGEFLRTRLAGSPS